MVFKDGMKTKTQEVRSGNGLQKRDEDQNSRGPQWKWSSREG
ncbi:hypothetical protein [Bacillus salipaludis]|nr:hypothetical protein [Bacillus salipaludis]